MELIYGYMSNDDLRHKLNDLTKKTFGFDFENWFKEGYFENEYIPYSFMENNKIISNVSANQMYFMQDGVKKKYIQIGTVMTDELYRNKGLAKKLMEYVIKQYKDTFDGIYLFSNLSTIDFYKKIGFVEGMQYQYSLKSKLYVKENLTDLFFSIDENDNHMKQKYKDSIRQSKVNSRMEQINKFSLQMFYTYNMEEVYYAKGIDCFVVMKMEGDTLILKNIICKEKVSLRAVISRINKKYNNLILGFTPCIEDEDMFNLEKFNGDYDYRFLYLGRKLESIENDKLYFPQLSHA